MSGPAPPIIEHPHPNPAWLARLTEDVLEPDLPIIDPHHHLWDRPGSRYHLDELLDADAVAARMRETPLSDFYNKDIRIEANGCVPHTMYLWQVKPSSEATHKWDVFKPLATIPSPEAYPPSGLFGCPLVRS